MPYVRAVAWALTLLQSSTGSAATVEEVRVAVLAPLRAEAAEHQWERMEDYLQAEVGHPVRIETLGPEALTHAIERETHDFFITNPVIYAHHEQSRALTRVATLLRTGPRGEPLDRFAGLLVVRRDRDDLHSSKDLTGATLGAVGPLGLGGYLMQRRYLLSLGIDTERDMSTIFLGVPQRRIVSAVLEGRADVGAVRTGVLEAMIARGELDGDELRVLDALPASPELPYIHTTRAYPEFALAIGPKVPTELARRVAAAFMRLPGDHPAAQATGVAGWTLPGEYSEVHELLRELRLGPYADFGRFTLGDVLRQYLGFVLAGFVMFMAILALTGYALLAQRRVAARNESLALVLDNIGQGFVRVRADGTVHPEVSARARRWLGEQVAGNSMAALLSRVDPEAGARFGLGLGCVFDPIVPIEVAFTQLPQQMTTGDRRVVRFAYRALEGQELLVVLEDVTDLLESGASEKHQRELSHISRYAINDRAGLWAFISETNQLLETLKDPLTSPTEQKRIVHTIKGTTAAVGLHSVSKVCHELESKLEDGLEAGPELELGLDRSWKRARRMIEEQVGNDSLESIVIEGREYSALLGAVRRGSPPPRVSALIESWRLERGEDRLRTLGEQAKNLARTMGRGALRVVVRCDALRFERETWCRFWAALVHVARNAVDHGLEPLPDRGAKGPPTLNLEARRHDRELIIVVGDDGRGLDLEAIQDRARAAGLPYETERELVAALCEDGLTTREEATEISGRGWGMAAVRQATEALGGRIDLSSEPGRGTEFRFVFPYDAPGLHFSAPTQWTQDLEEKQRR